MGHLEGLIGGVGVDRYGERAKGEVVGRQASASIPVPAAGVPGAEDTAELLGGLAPAVSELVRF